MKDYKELKDGRRVYDFSGVRSRQTGGNAETVMIIGAKNSGKTFNVRLLCLDDYIANGRCFVEVSRTKDESDDVAAGYFDRITLEGLYPGFVFKTDKRAAYIAKAPKDGGEPDKWEICGYFAALTMFQRTKRRSNYINVCNAIFDEFIIDSRDVYHRYLKDEFGILMNCLNSIMRPFPNDGIRRYIFMLGNSCDLSCPHLRALGVDRLPEFGYNFYKNKKVLLHYVKPWDAEASRTETIIGRMMAGTDDGSIFDNLFDAGDDSTIAKKGGRAKFAFAIVFQKMRLGIWSDLKGGIFYITERVPKDAANVYALTKADGTIDYQVIARTSPLLRLVSDMFRAGGLRYESYHVREAFFRVLDYLGIR